MATRVTPVNTFFRKCARYGLMRSIAIPPAHLGEISAKHGPGFVDYSGPYLGHAMQILPGHLVISGKVRMISGVARVGRKEYILSVMISKDQFKPFTPTLEARAKLSYHPIRRGTAGVPDYGMERQIGFALEFSVPIGDKESFEDYCTRKTPEALFTILANRNRDFHNMIKKFNSSVALG